MKQLLSKFPALVLSLMVTLIASSSAFGSATIVIQNNDQPNVGFNDPTAVAPVGGNNGTTVGQQRLNAFQFAANIWGATLTSGPTITIGASWAALPCSANSATLGSAGVTNIRGNFPGAPFTNTWYGVSLANALSNGDLNQANPEISARFNVNLGTSGCLQNSHWYYGFDNNHGTTGIDLVTVLLHEFSHGLGFQSFTDEETGAQPQGFPSIYDRFLLDNSTGKTWPQMTNSERVASAINTGNLVWNGANVTSDAATVLSSGKDSLGHPQMFAPAAVDAGSSVSHWDRFPISPNQLMEPVINTDLTHSVTTPQDLTFSLFKDIGWCSGCPQPPPPPSPTPTPAAAANDNLANAQTITGCSGSVTGHNFGATHEPGEVSHSPDLDPGGGSVWYKWQAPSSGSVTVTTAGSDYDTLLAVYDGSSFPLTLIVRNDDVDPTHVDTTSSVTFTATAGKVYRIAVDGWSNDRGNIVLNWTESGCTVTAPALLIEDGTTDQAAALDSVTQVRGPFSKIGFFNFSSDQRTRLMLFTTNLGLSQGDNPGLSVQLGGVSLPVENVGTVPGQSQFSYIVVRLTDPVPTTGPLDVNVTLHGVTSNTAKISIVP